MNDMTEKNDVCCWNGHTGVRNVEVAEAIDDMCESLDIDVNGEPMGDRFVKVRRLLGASGETHVVGVFSLSGGDDVPLADAVLTKVREVIAEMRVG